MDINELLTLHETFPSLIPLIGKAPFEKNWQRWCQEPRPFNAEDFKKYNAGLTGGPANGVMVLDVDHVQKFNRLLKAKKWKLPETRVHLTGSGKPHYLYQYPNNGHAYGCRSVNDPEGEIDPKTGKVIKVFDVKGLGGQVVAPGSIHPNTKKQYIVHNELPIAPAPEWLLDLSKQNGDSQKQEQQPLKPKSAKKVLDLESLQLSYPIKKLILEGEARGKRSEAIMSTLNALVRAGLSDAQIIEIFDAHAIGEKYREVGNTREKWLIAQLSKTRELRNKTPVKAGGPSMAEIRQYIDLSVEGGQSFMAEDICKAFAAYKKEERAPIYIYLSRLVQEQIIKKDPYKHGLYRKVLQIDAYDMEGGIETKTFDVYLPLELHKLLEIEPGHLISIAGSTDAGKSAFLYHVMKLNYREHRVIHFSSPEWSQNAIKKRMDEIGIERPHPNITCYPMEVGYEDLIPQDPCIVLVDYLRTNEQFNELDRQYYSILRNIKNSLALTAIQKHIGKDKPTGGQYAVHAPHHILLLDPWKDAFICKIYKTKNERRLSGFYRLFTYKDKLMKPIMAEWKKGEIRWGEDQPNQSNRTNNTNN